MNDILNPPIESHCEIVKDSRWRECDQNLMYKVDVEDSDIDNWGYGKIRKPEEYIVVLENHKKIIDERINRFKKALSGAPDMMITYAYDENDPSVIAVGDCITTKYGETGVIFALDKVKDLFYMGNDRGRVKEYMSHRLGGVNRYAQPTKFGVKYDKS